MTSGRLLLLLGSTANCVKDAQAQGMDHCTCMGADVSYRQIECRHPDGSTFTATQTCWTKKSLNTGAPCGTVCDATFNVCNRMPGLGICR